MLLALGVIADVSDRRVVDAVAVIVDALRMQSGVSDRLALLVE